MELSARLEGKILFLAHNLCLFFGISAVFITLSCFISSVSPKIKCRESGSTCLFHIPAWW